MARRTTGASCLTKALRRLLIAAPPFPCRYWTQDLDSLNDKFGSEDDLKALVSAAHDKDIYVMVDVVVNQCVAAASGSCGS